jgi:hypothetical protein
MDFVNYFVSSLEDTCHPQSSGEYLVHRTAIVDNESNHFCSNILQQVEQFKFLISLKYVKRISPIS